MDTLQTKDLITSRGLNYHYYVSPPSTYDSLKPALVLQHGWPESAHMWVKLVQYLSKLSNRLLIPDMLGYGGTSKPTDAKTYAYNLMVKDLTEIFDAEGIDKVISVGHDHGVGIASRLYNHAPNRVAAVILMNVAYNPPAKGQQFNLTANNARFTQAFGYPAHEYWNFFTEPDAAEVMGSNLERLWTFAHPATPQQMKDAMGVPGAPRRMMLDPAATAHFPTKAHADDQELKRHWIKNLADGGLEAPMQWYHALVTGVQDKSNNLVSDGDEKVNVPMLFIGCDEDMVCRHELIRGPQQAGLLPDLKVEVLQGVGHWPMYERPEEVAGLISGWVKEKGL